MPVGKPMGPICACVWYPNATWPSNQVSAAPPATRMVGPAMRCRQALTTRGGTGMVTERNDLPAPGKCGIAVRPLPDAEARVPVDADVRTLLAVDRRRRVGVPV